VARGNYRLDSDIDLSIITKDKKLMELAQSIADKILIEHGKLVSIKFIDEEELKRRKSPLIDQIEKGIVIYNRRRR
jgi:predicted nucleotidyltransferase